MSPKNTVKKSVQPGRNGGTLKVGNPGNKGGTGRPANWLRDWCDELLARDENKAAVERVLKDEKHPAHSTMWGKIADRAHGKPAQTLEHTGKDGGPLTLRVEYADENE